ncbi:tetratricopeptide repeat protein [Tolypothrix campylonemoides VB511288_2]
MNHFNQCFRFILNFSIAVGFVCFFLTLPAYPSPAPNIQMTAGDFFKLGVEKMLDSNYRLAVKDFTEAIQLRSHFTAAYSNRCLANLQLGDYQNAIADCDRAIEFAPNNAEPYLNRGLARYRLGHYQAAIADNDRAIALQPNNFKAYYNRGVASAMLGNYQQAISDYNLALTQIPQTSNLLLAEIYNERGLAHFQLLNLQTALLDFSTALRLDPNNYRAYYNRGCVCGRSGDNKSAIADFTASLKLQPNNASAHFNRGVAYDLLGYKQAAITDLQKAADNFAFHQETAAHRKTLDFLQNIRRQLPFLSEIALVAKKSLFTLCTPSII